MVRNRKPKREGKIHRKIESMVKINSNKLSDNLVKRSKSINQTSTESEIALSTLQRYSM